MKHRTRLKSIVEKHKFLQHFLDKSVHLEQRQAIALKKQQRVEKAVQLAAQPRAPGRWRAERLEDEAAAVPDPKPIVVAAGLDGEA